MGYSFQLTARVLLYAPPHRQDCTYHSLCYVSRGALAGTRNSSMGPLHEGLIRRPIAPWANALTKLQREICSRCLTLALATTTLTMRSCALSQILHSISFRAPLSWIKSAFVITTSTSSLLQWSEETNNKQLSLNSFDLTLSNITNRTHWSGQVRSGQSV